MRVDHPNESDNGPRIAAELLRIESALRDPQTTSERYGQLYAAQQALAWAMDESLAAAPYDVISTGKVMPPMGIPGD